MVPDAQTLKGKTVALTRPCGQAEEAADAVRKRGGEPYFIPAIEVKSPGNLAPIRKFVEELAAGRIDYVIFMSVNGVKYLLEAAENLQQPDQLREGLEKAKVVAVGPRTAQELQMNQIRVDMVPAKYTSEGVLELLQRQNLSGKSIRIPRTSAASPALMEKLAEMGGVVEEIYVYESALPVDSGLMQRFLRDLAAGRIDAVVFGSSLCASNLFRMVNAQTSAEKLCDLLNEKVTVVAIGPVTAETLGKLGVKVEVMPEKHMFEEALTALANYWSAR